MALPEGACFYQQLLTKNASLQVSLWNFNRFHGFVFFERDLLYM